MIQDKALFVNQMGDLLGKYQNHCGAACLFYLGTRGIGTQYGVRIEAPFIAKQFIANVHFGRDPEGLLFYDNEDDFDLDGETVTYQCFRNCESPPAVRIEFKISGQIAPICVFLTKDTNGLTSNYLESINSGKGTWSDLLMASTYGRLHKITKGTELAISMSPIGKRLTFNIDNNRINTSTSINLIGTFSYLHSADLDNSSLLIADFNEDRILLYRSNAPSQMVGLFIPSKAIPKLTGNDEVSAEFSNL